MFSSVANQTRNYFKQNRRLALVYNIPLVKYPHVHLVQLAEHCVSSTNVTGLISRDHT